MTQFAQVNAGNNVVNKTTKKKLVTFQNGQGMTEYIIIVALIAVAAIAVYQFFGQTIRSQTSAIANEVGGKSGKDAMTDAGNAGAATNAERKNKGLANYADGASKVSAAPAP